MSDTSPSIALRPVREARATLVSDASLIGVALIWGINIPIMKTGLDQANIFVFNAVRLTLSAGVLSMLALQERRRGILPHPGVQLRELIVYAISISAVYHVLFLLGISHTTSGNTALIICTIPLWTALLARVFLGERLRRLAWGGLLLALVGTIIVALQKGDVTGTRQHLWGNLSVLAAALMWAGATVYSRPLLKKISPMQLSASAAVLALPVHLLIPLGHYTADLPALMSPDMWLVILYSGVLSSGLALPMWSYGVRHAGAAHSAVIQNLVPLVAIVAAWIGRGEVATTAQLVGGGLILGGLIIMRLSRLRAATAPSERSTRVSA